MDNPNAPKQEGSNPAPQVESSNPAPAPEESNPAPAVEKPNPAPAPEAPSNPAPAPEESNPAPAPEVEKPNPAPEAPSNPAPEVEKPNPAPEEVGSNPAPEAPPAPKKETKTPAPKNVGASKRDKKFNSANPEEQFNQIEQGDIADLHELSPQLKKGLVGVGWDLIGFDESAADLDVSLFLLDKNDETREDSDFIFYGNEEALDGGIKHTGDSRTGAGSGDDEQIIIDFSTVPFDVATIAVVLTIYDPENKEYSFQNVRNVYMRVEDSETERELFRYFIDEELRQVPENEGTANCMHIGNFVRDANNWTFTALGKIDDGGLAKIATHYGLVIVMS